MNRAARIVVLTYALVWFLLNVFRAALPILLPELRRLYDVGFTDAGLVFALLFAGIALMQFPSGVLADAVGDREVIFGSLVASSVALSLFGFATTFPALLVLGFWFGVAVGGFRSVAISSVSKVVGDDERSTALGLMAAGNPLGNLLGPILAAQAIVALGVVWMPVSFGIVGVGWSACLGLLLFRVGGADGVNRLSGSGSSGSARRAVARQGSRLRAVLTSRPGALVVVASMAFSMTWQGLFTFLPSYLVEVRQLALGGTGVVTGVTFGIGIVANVAAGRVADRIGDPLVLLGGFLFGACSLVVLRVAGGFPAAVAALLGIGLGLGAITPARDAVISRLSDPDDRGSVVGGVRTTYILLASAGTALVGFTIDTAGFGEALLLLTATLLVGAGASLALFVTKPSEGETPV